MPRITVDGKIIECKDRQMILQACLDAGIFLPHYCYHPGLSIPASCRICLVEVEGIPKLVPSCQTPVRDGMVVHSKSSKAIANQKAVMEYLLINHPLDCPVCDQAGECLLQDYSYQYGRTESRFEEDKAKKPKKDVGLHVLLYNDRCIMCTRCVRFTREISGTGELYVDGRGHREEIDIFPGKPLDNKLSGNVVDICPVGALLDKDFLFKQRVWLLKRTPSISPVDAGGENIWLEHNQNVIYRIKPRYNPDVNQWWISDDTRYCYKAVHDEKRLTRPTRLQFGAQVHTSYQSAIEQADAELKRTVRESGVGSLFAMLSPMMACEEAWLLGTYIRKLDPQAVLVLGPVPTSGENEVFRNSITGQVTFVIQAEKVPNRRGVQRVISLLGGPTATLEELGKSTRLKGGWIVGGYLSDWVTDALKLPRGVKVVQDILPNKLTGSADALLPAAAWAEKDGVWENHAGQLQAFSAAVTPPAGAMREGDVYYRLLGRAGLYNAEAVRQEMGEPFASVKIPSERAEEPAFEFVEL
ncbi:2Fe-2S iron-sulfur cluster-binding protein [Fontivita pretiosa]|uniref:2Fe-2S iron-sulfur cluster-binding protein n=1 Tax=Fontivita pretiosa TaxID=2989684 RepID=UPI003D173875